MGAARGPIAGVSAALALVAGLACGTAPGRDLAPRGRGARRGGGRRGRRSGGRPLGAVEGALADVVPGRWVLFLARSPGDDTRDVWRARVRVSPDGQRRRRLGAYDLTSTPLGDDHALVVRDDHAAFATRAYGQEQSVTVLDLAGEGAQNKTTALSDRIMAAITNLQQTGSAAGVGRVDVTLESPARAVGLALGDDALDLALVGDDARGAAQRERLDLASGELAPPPPGVRADAVDAPAQAALALGGRHGARGLVDRAGAHRVGWRTRRSRSATRTGASRSSRGLDGATRRRRQPADAARPRCSTPRRRRSTRRTGRPRASRRCGRRPSRARASGSRRTSLDAQACRAWRPDAPSPFYRTFVRPDEERPYAKVLLVAMDMRQLDLEMEAGVEDPEPLTGPHGTGRIPRDPAIYRRVAAAFNGAFKTEHGHYGMMVNKRVLLPPVPGAATVIVPTTGASASARGARTRTSAASSASRTTTSSPSARTSTRSSTTTRSTRRAATSGASRCPGKGVQTERSGLCVTKPAT